MVYPELYKLMLSLYERSNDDLEDFGSIYQVVGYPENWELAKKALKSILGEARILEKEWPPFRVIFFAVTGIKNCSILQFMSEQYNDFFMSLKKG